MATTWNKEWTDIPGYLAPGTTGPSGWIPQWFAAQQQFPSLAELPGEVPTLGVPGLTPDQERLIQQMMATGAASPDRAAARQQLQQLTSGPVGSSPATQAGMQAFQQLVAPSIMQTQALQGTASGGAALEAMGQGATAAAVPLIQQEIQNRQQAVGQYGQLGQEQLMGLAAAFEAAGLPREVALEQAQAAFDAAQQRLGIESGLQTFPLQMLSQLLSRTQQQHSTQYGSDIVAGIGQGLSPSGLFGAGGK